MSFDPSRPFNDLPLLPLAEDIETREVLKRAIPAGRALAELKGMGTTIPNQGILINTIVLQEAQASSEIENIVTTTDVLFEALSTERDNIDPATKEVLRYREALWAGFNALAHRPLTTNLFVEVVQTIKQNRAGIRQTPGTTVKNASTGETIYTPPEGENVIRDKLKNLEDYIHTDDGVDPLVKMAIIHYQFEAIHPFSDGNGRTGRIINLLFLLQQELLELPVLYLSKSIIDRKNEYYALLRGVTTEGNWEAWLLYMLEAIETTARMTRNRIIAIRELMDEITTLARDRLPSRVYSKELLELLFHQPYTKAKFLVEAGIAKRQTAAEYLKELERIGILKSHKVGRENLYLNVRLFKLISESEPSQ